MQTIKAIYRGNQTIELLENIDLVKGTKLELTFDFPDVPDSDKTELGQSIIRGLKDAIAGRVKVIKSARDLENWIGELSDKV